MGKNIAVIGGGPAGYISALRAAQLGGNVTLIEQDALGGTCLNRGCIPTKALLKSAHIFKDCRDAAQFGIAAGKPEADYPKVLARKDMLVKQFGLGIRGLLKAAGVTVVNGRASFLSPDELSVTPGSDGPEKRVTADRFIIAAGSRPALPPVSGMRESGIMTSDEIFGMRELPESILIIGGGVIGVEFATVFTTFGVRVTIVEMLQRLVPTVDAELGRALLKNLENKGITVHLGCRVAKVERQNGSFVVSVLHGDGSARTLTAEKALVCTGRRANTEGLGLRQARVFTTEHGFISVDIHMKTSQANIYAAGDVNGGIQLAHVASREGEIAAENAMGIESPADWRAYPGCIFTFPEIASAGLTADEAEVRGVPVKIGRFPFSANGKAMVENETGGFVKIVADARDDKVLGVHIMGPQASVMICEGMLAIEKEATLFDLAKTIHAHPTLGESMAEAALQADNRAFHMINGRK